MADGAGPPPFTMRRWLRLYLPLSLTFLLMSGSNPVINKGIGHLPADQEAVGLAAFTTAFALCVFLYSPCFAVRDAAQKFVRGRTSHRRTMVFHMAVAGVCTAVLLFVSLTPVADRLLLAGVLDLPPGLVGPVKRAILAFAPIPVLVTIRGVYQAVHITNDTPNRVGQGTALRFLAMTIFVFAVGVPLEFEGGVMGGLALSVGIAAETAIVWLAARREARFLGEDPPGAPPPDTRDLWKFTGPLLVANLTGIFLQTLTIAIVNGAARPAESAAAFGVVKSFTWFFCSTLFALQTMVLARGDSVGNLLRLVVYSTVPVALFTGLMLLVLYVPGAERWLLVDFFAIDDEGVRGFIRTALPWAVMLPAIMAVRSASRGLLMRGGRTGLLTVASVVSLAALIGVLVADFVAGVENGAEFGYTAWIAVLSLETALLLAGVFAAGVDRCVREGRRAEVPVLPGAPQPERL